MKGQELRARIEEKKLSHNMTSEKKKRKSRN
jgi:hypothetical protein